MIIRSEKYPQLLVVGVVQFLNGAAEVDDPALIERLRKYSSVGVVVPDAAEAPAPDLPPASLDDQAAAETPPPADNEHVADGAELFEPKGNASLEEWQAYATQKGIPADHLEGLKREEVKALLSE